MANELIVTNQINLLKGYVQMLQYVAAKSLTLIPAESITEEWANTNKIVQEVTARPLPENLPQLLDQ